MRQTFYILITFLISFNGFSQCDDIEKLEFGGTYLSKTRNYIPFDLEISDTIKYCCDSKKIQKYLDVIIPKAKDFITKRANSDFYNRLEIHQIEVNYDKEIDISYSNQELYELSNYPTHTYWILYTYRNNGIEYGFGLEFNKDGKMVSENKFPDFSLNPEFENLNEPCLALEKVKSDERFKDKKVGFIELAYIDDINSFCWLIQEDYNVSKKQDIEFEKWYEYSEQSYYVNVNTNKIEKIEDKKKQVVYCGYKLTKKTKD
jgi:hypothetical protein